MQEQEKIPRKSRKEINKTVSSRTKTETPLLRHCHLNLSHLKSNQWLGRGGGGYLHAPKWVQLDTAKKCLKSKVGTLVVGCKQNPSYSIRGCHWIRKVHAFQLFVVVSHAHCDRRHWRGFTITRRDGLTGCWHPLPTLQSAPLSSASNLWELGSAAGVQPSDRQLHSSAAPQSTICQNEDDLDYWPQKRVHKQLFELALQSAYLKAAATILPILPSSGAAAANPFRLRDTHRDLSWLGNHVKGPMPKMGDCC